LKRYALQAWLMGVFLTKVVGLEMVRWMHFRDAALF
jgi:hypothetical protein